MAEKSSQITDTSSKPVMYFHHAGLTHTGMLRDHNEDNYTLPGETETNSLMKKGYLYVLADGMGGHQKGEVAAAVTVKAVPSEYYSKITALVEEKDAEEAIVNTLRKAIAKANLEVMKATEGGGTTIVTTVLYADLLVTMNVGDSRAYLLRDNELRLISRDHSLVSRLVEMGKITEEEALTHPRRNVLYQALGQGSDLEIHVVTEKLQLDDTIILCSDGLWGEIRNETLKQVLTSAASPRVAAQQLVDMANEAGGPDNITAVIIHTSDEEPPLTNYIDERSYTPAIDDTQPSLQVDHQKPDTLPEGRYHTGKNKHYD